MSDERFEIDYDAEAVFFENQWMGRDDLARAIRAMIDRGDYRVARPSYALERLEAALAKARVLAVRVAPELAEAAETRAAREGKSVSALLREILAVQLGAPQQPTTPPRQNGEAPSQPAAEELSAIVLGGQERMSLDDPQMEESWFGR